MQEWGVEGGMNPIVQSFCSVQQIKWLHFSRRIFKRPPHCSQEPMPGPHAEAPKKAPGLEQLLRFAPVALIWIYTTTLSLFRRVVKGLGSEGSANRPRDANLLGKSLSRGSV